MTNLGPSNVCTINPWPKGSNLLLEARYKPPYLGIYKNSNVEQTLLFKGSELITSSLPFQLGADGTFPNAAWTSFKGQIDKIELYNWSLPVSGPSVPPWISSFSVNPSNIKAGESATLSWNISNADSLYINQQKINISDNTLIVSPSTTTTYTLTAINSAGKTTKEISLIVDSNSLPFSNWCYDFKNNLSSRMSGIDIKNLHIALEREGFLISSQEKSSQKFGRSTMIAVSDFQKKYQNEILSPLNLKYPTGYVGNRTRKKLNQLYGCSLKSDNSYINSTSPIKNENLESNNTYYSVNLISPNGNENLEIGNSYDIKWNTMNVPPNAQIQIKLKDTRYDPKLYGSKGEVLITKTTNNGFYNWIIPSKIENMILGAGNVYKIEIYVENIRGEILDLSDNNFSITDKKQNIFSCNEIMPFNNILKDASSIIQKCINNTPDGNMLEIPTGKYYVGYKIRIEKPIILRTAGKNENMPKCDIENHDCAEIVALPSFSDVQSIFEINSPGSSIDHIVINGNNLNRIYTETGRRCRFDNIYQNNILILSSDVKITNSVSKNTLRGTALGINANKNNINIYNNTFAYNGIHDRFNLIADGLTVIDSENSKFINNEFIDNTDVQLIFGGCKNCEIKNNIIKNTGSLSGASYAALMIHQWNFPGKTSGDYSNTIFSNNFIDCSNNKRCVFGLLVGSDAWYESNPYGANIFSNTVKNAEIGIAIDDANNIKIYNNTILPQYSEKLNSSLCGNNGTIKYTIGSRSFNIDTSQDALNSSYIKKDWDGCVANSSWWPSKEYFVENLYHCILSRSPEKEGLQYWVNQLNSASSLENIYKGFFSSPEYLSKSTIDEQYINQLYNCVLFRSYDETGYKYWLNKLKNENISREKVLNSFLTSPEFNDRIKNHVLKIVNF